MRKLLLVEGAGDKDFFTKLFEKVLNFPKSGFNIQILVPTDLGAEKDGKEYVKKAIIDVIKANSESEYSIIGCILDADYGNNQRITDILTKLIDKTISYSYDSFHIHQDSGGYYLQSNDGLKNVGIWFMPNNQDEGMLEDWLLKIANDTEKQLIQYSDKVCKDSPEIRFNKDKDFSKAKVGVWTALQKSPHLGTENIILHKLYNEQSSDYKSFITWLKFVFGLSV